MIYQKNSIFIKNHSKRDTKSNNSKLFARSLRSRRLGVISAFINITLIWGYRKLGNLTSKPTLNVCKNDCTCARNKLSFYLLYVNEIAKIGCFVVKTVRSTRGQNMAVRST